MTTTVRERFLLKFRTNLGRMAQFSIPRALNTKTTQQVLNVMTEMLDSGTLHVTGKGTPSEVKGAKFIITETKKVF